MKTGYWLSSVCAFVLFTSIICAQQMVLSFAANDRNIVSPAPLNSIVLLPVANPRKLAEIEQAYLDSFSILKYDSPCSRFYGGPAAIAALNELTQQLRPTRLDRRIGVRMQGATTIISSQLTGFTFRVFEKAEVNLEGSFYRASTASHGSVPRVGPFYPNTREARVTTFLHELGHLVKKADGRWLLPNDGSDPGESEENTRRVLGVCSEQIKALHNSSFEKELLGAQAATARFG